MGACPVFVKIYTKLAPVATFHRETIQISSQTMHTVCWSTLKSSRGRYDHGATDYFARNLKANLMKLTKTKKWVIIEHTESVHDMANPRGYQDFVGKHCAFIFAKLVG
jgi:hypothetical protein